LDFRASRREIDWKNFVSGVASCASLAATNNTFDCLRAANTSEIFIGLNQSLAEAPELFGFDPTIDGPCGLFPEIPSKLFKTGRFARLPFMAGTNQDEGSYIVNIKRNIFYNPPSCF
jgi:acetylcholinesterase